MWIARDKNEDLFIFNNHPKRITRENDLRITNNLWWDNGDKLGIDTNIFPSLKWEDEPIEVKLVEV